MTSHVDDKPAPPMVGRRAVARGAAWSVPVVALAVAAPAVAASTNCTMGTLNWDNFRDGASGLGTFATTVPGLTVTLTSTGGTGAANNAQVTSTQTGGLSKVLRFYDLENVANTSQTVTITFNKQVRNLSFSFLDVDSAMGNHNQRSYEDLVWITTPSSWSGTTHRNVQGSGTAAKPYRAVNLDSPVDGTSADSNVDLTFVGPLSTVTFVYGQDGSVDGGPFIGISDLVFQYCT
jgi:hypothetical protein